MPGGEAVWVQLLDRQQKHLILAVIATGSFVPSNSDSAGVLPQVYVLWEETSTTWISVSESRSHFF